MFVLQAESRSLTFGTVFAHIETPRNCEKCMETWLSTQTDPVGTIQSKAASQRSFPVVIELSHLCNGHTLLTQYSGATENIEMSRSSFREKNFWTVKCLKKRQCLRWEVISVIRPDNTVVKKRLAFHGHKKPFILLRWWPCSRSLNFFQGYDCTRWKLGLKPKVQDKNHCSYLTQSGTKS